MDFTAADKPQVVLHIHKSLNYTLFDTKWRYRAPSAPRATVAFTQLPYALCLDAVCQVASTQSFSSVP